MDELFSVNKRGQLINCLLIILFIIAAFNSSASQCPKDTDLYLDIYDKLGNFIESKIVDKSPGRDSINCNVQNYFLFHSNNSVLIEMEPNRELGIAILNIDEVVSQFGTNSIQISDNDIYLWTKEFHFHIDGDLLGKLNDTLIFGQLRDSDSVYRITMVDKSGTPQFYTEYNTSNLFLMLPKLKNGTYYFDDTFVLKQATFNNGLLVLSSTIDTRDEIQSTSGENSILFSINLLNGHVKTQSINQSLFDNDRDRNSHLYPPSPNSRNFLVSSDGRFIAIAKGNTLHIIDQELNFTGKLDIEIDYMGLYENQLWIYRLNEAIRTINLIDLSVNSAFENPYNSSEGVNSYNKNDYRFVVTKDYYLSLIARNEVIGTEILFIGSTAMFILIVIPLLIKIKYKK